MTNYQFYQSIRICPECKNTPLGKDEKRCPVCRAKNTERIAKRRECPEVRLRMNSQSARIKRKKYYERKEQGICVECGKYRAKTDKVRCPICLYKSAEKARLIRMKGIVHEHG